MPGPGGYQFNRMVTFLEVNFSQYWYHEQPDTFGFVSYQLLPGEDGSLNITRLDGKVLSLEVKAGDHFAVQTQENVIRWTSSPENHSDGPFQ